MVPTLREIAEAVGVSIPTVSRVLRGTEDAMVTDATRERIIQVAEEIGYHPNPHARALARGKSTAIAVIAPNSPQLMNSLKTWSLCNHLAELGRGTMVFGIDQTTSIDDLEGMLLSASPEAVVILTSGWPEAKLRAFCQELHRSKIWPLLVDPIHWDPAAELASDAVLPDRSEGAATAVRYLIERGHRHIGFVGASIVEARAIGYHRALDEHGITERYVEAMPPDGNTAHDGAEAVTRLLQHFPSVTGLFCYSDLAALGAMRGIEGLGLAVPADVAVVGFDNQPWTEFLSVPLTTVAQPVERMCLSTVELLGRRLGGDTGAWRRVRINPELVVRDSTEWGTRESLSADVYLDAKEA